MTAREAEETLSLACVHGGMGGLASWAVAAMQVGIARGRDPEVAMHDAWCAVGLVWAHRPDLPMPTGPPEGKGKGDDCPAGRPCGCNARSHYRASAAMNAWDGLLTWALSRKDETIGQDLPPPDELAAEAVRYANALLVKVFSESNQPKE